MADQPDIFGGLDNLRDNNNAIPYFDKNGTALSQEARKELARKRGLCLTCGVKTHETRVFGKKALNNPRVHNGTCIQCNQDSVPRNVREQWEARFGTQQNRPQNRPGGATRFKAAVHAVATTTNAAHHPHPHGTNGARSRHQLTASDRGGASEASSRHRHLSSSEHGPSGDKSPRHRPLTSSDRPEPSRRRHLTSSDRPGVESSRGLGARNMSSKHNSGDSSHQNYRKPQPKHPPLQVAPSVEDFTGCNSDENMREIVAALRDPRMKDDSILVRRKLHRLRNLGKTFARRGSGVLEDQNRAVYEVRELMGVYRDDPQVMAVACGAMWSLAATSDDCKMVANDAGIIDVVIDSLRNSRNQREKDFVTWAFGLIEVLARLSPNKANIANAGGIDTIVRILNVNGSSPAVFEWACRALHSLVHQYAIQGDPDYRDSAMEIVWQNVHAAVDAGCVAAVMKTMKNHTGESAAEEWALKLLWRLLDQQDESATKKVLKKINDEDGVVLCVDLLKVRSTTPDSFQMAAALICELLARKNDKIASKSAAEGIHTTVRVMEDDSNEDNESLQEACCGFLATMTGVGKESRKCIDEAHGVVAVVRAMNNFPWNRGIMESGSYLLWSFSVNVPGDLQRTLPDALRALNLGTDRHVDSPLLQAAACAFIANLAAAQVVDVSELPSEILTRALSLNGGDAAVREGACRALAYICTQSASGEMESDICDSLIDSMISSGPEEQEALCSALSSIATSSTENRKALVASGCVDAATQVLEKADSEKAAASALGLISALAVTETRQYSPLPPHCVQTIVGALRTKLHSSELQQRACSVLRNLLLGSSPGSSSLDVAGLVDAMTRIIDSSSDELALKKEACGVLWALMAKQQRQDVAVLSKMFNSVLNAMALYRGEERPYNSDLQFEAVGALSSITLSLQDHTFALEKTAVDSVIAVMYMMLEFDVERIEVLEKVLDVILNLSFIDENIVIQCGGIVVVIDAMVEHETIESIQERGCSILAVLSSTENLQVNLCIAETDGIDMIVSSLAVFTENERIQVDACKALSHLSVDHESRMLISSQGGLILVVNAMNASRNRDNIALLEGACSALLNLSSDAEEQALSGTSAVKTVVDLMRYHPDEQTFQEKGLGVLQNVSMRNSSAKRAIAQAGGISVVTTAIREYMGSPAVLERAFTTMWSLAVLEQNQILIADTGGIGLVVNGMMANINYEKVQKQACGCLCTLSSNSRNKNLIRDAGGVDAIVFAMWAHYDSEVLQVEACRALSSLAVNVQTNEVMIATDGEISAIISAMRRFPQSSKLQEHACVALRNFMLSADNATLIRSNADELISLMTRAARKFPDRCAERANQVLASLS